MCTEQKAETPHTGLFLLMLANALSLCPELRFCGYGE